MKSQDIETVLKKEGKCIIPIKGVSMLPMLEEKKDTVVLKPINSKLKKGDVALYKVGEFYILHRIIKVKKTHYVCCGDNCIAKEKVPFQWVFAVAEGFYKNGKYISCNDAKYLKYSKKRCRSRWRRALVRKTLYALGKIFKRDSKTE